MKLQKIYIPTEEQLHIKARCGANPITVKDVERIVMTKKELEIEKREYIIEFLQMLKSNPIYDGLEYNLDTHIAENKKRITELKNKQ